MYAVRVLESSPLPAIGSELPIVSPEAENKPVLLGLCSSHRRVSFTDPLVCMDIVESAP